MVYIVAGIGAIILLAMIKEVKIEFMTKEERKEKGNLIINGKKIF